MEPWIEQAARRIAANEEAHADAIDWQDVAEVIQQQWQEFNAGCPKADEPPILPATELEERIAALELKMDELWATKRPAKRLPTYDCSQQCCSYYTEYLKNHNGDRHGEKLSHAAFHSAEGCLEAVQAQLGSWASAHPGQKLPKHLLDRADYWEKRCAK